MAFPELNSAEQAQLEQTRACIGEAIAEAGGRIPFDRYMELALYAPGAGYYVNGARKFGVAGDFVTAPEISPLFSRTLAAQLAEVLATSGGEVLEFGAGSGVMAAEILAALAARDALPERYLIMELSAELRARQAETLRDRVPGLVERVHWLDRLPGPGWRGVVVANELLDALPVSRFCRTADGWVEQFVTIEDGVFQPLWDAPETPGLVDALARIEERLGPFAEGYASEICLRLPAWMRAVADFLAQGVLLLIDYGYSEREYYHPARRDGTLICHFRQRAFDDPFALPGLADITASVDFSAVAEAGVEAGMELVGYTTQAQFLLGCGIEHELAALAADPARIGELQRAKQLIMPTAMGERFRVIGLAAGELTPLSGFAMGDLRAML